jgi:seryl-tRNA synthetase
MPEHLVVAEQVIPPNLIDQVQAKLAYVDETIKGVKVAGDGKSILFTLRSEPDSSALTDLEVRVQQVIRDMSQGFVAPRIEILEDHSDRTVPFSEDPVPELMERGEIIREHTGIYGFGPLVTRLIEVFERYFLSLAREFNAAPYRFPTLISAEKLGQVDYYRAFPHSLTFATHLREDLDVINDFSRSAAYDNEGLSTKLDSFSRIQALLSPAVCYHLYFALAGKTLPKDMAATAAGHCFRYESSNLRSLERMWDFTMREIIFVGSAEYVLEKREQARKRVETLFGEIGLAYSVESANDPFFVGEFRKQAAFQNAFQLKYEIRAGLPFKGSTLAVGSYNYHQSFFGRSLDIHLFDGSSTHTGCVAFGLERLAFAFLSQFGPNPRHWPRPIGEAFE